MAEKKDDKPLPPPPPPAQDTNPHQSGSVSTHSEKPDRSTYFVWEPGKEKGKG
jgi:hypothetical protein